MEERNTTTILIDTIEKLLKHNKFKDVTIMAIVFIFCTTIVIVSALYFKSDYPVYPEVTQTQQQQQQSIR